MLHSYYSFPIQCKPCFQMDLGLKADGMRKLEMPSRKIPNRLPEISRKILTRLLGVFRENAKSEKNLKKARKTA